MKNYFDKFPDSYLESSRRRIQTPSAFARSAFFYVQETGYLKLRESHVASRKNLESYLVVLVLSGSGVLMYDGTIYELHKGSCFFIDCMVPYYHQSSETDPWELIWVHFNGSSSREYYQYFAANSAPAFMPADFYSEGYGLRQLQPDFVSQEKAWFGRAGFVPGIHILAMKADFIAAHPEAPRQLCELLRASQNLWLAKRRKYFETTPWLIADLIDMAKSLPEDWDPVGLEPNRRMLDEFARQQYLQKLTPVQRDADFLFPVKTI